MTALVLSLFPGAGLLDLAFHEAGFCCVRGPEWIFGQDIKEFHPPQGRFDGIIGGDPCQSHSALANLVRAKGLEPSFPDMTPEFQRVVEEARPAWFLRENVAKAPDIKPAGYDVRSFLLCNSTLDSGDGWGNEQMRRRRFWFGTRGVPCPELRQWMPFALFELPDAAPTVQGGCTGGVQAEALKRRQSGSFGHGPTPGQRDGVRRLHQTVSADARAVGVAVGGSGKRKVTAVGGHHGTADAINGYRKARRQAPVTGRHDGAVGTPEIDYSPPHRSLGEMLRLQGLPEDWMDRQPWTQQAKRKMVGNGVAMPTGRAIAAAIARWMGDAS